MDLSTEAKRILFIFYTITYISFCILFFDHIYWFEKMLDYEIDPSGTTVLFLFLFFPIWFIIKSGLEINKSKKPDKFEKTKYTVKTTDYYDKK